MEIQKIILCYNSRKDAVCDREHYFKTYGEFDDKGFFKKLRSGAPLVINIDGIYYYYDKLVPFFGCIDYYTYRRELLSPSKDIMPPIFIWR